MDRIDEIKDKKLLYKLEEKAWKLSVEILNSLPKHKRRKFDKFVFVMWEMEKLNIKIALDNTKEKI